MKKTDYITNKSLGKKLKTDFKTATKKSSLNVVFLESNNTDHNSVIINSDIETFRKFAKDVDKAYKKFKKEDKKRKKQGFKDINCFFRHLSPDVTFLIKYGKKK